MTDTEKDKFIVEALGYSWLVLRVTSLKTWDGFGWLWEKMGRREDWEEFIGIYNGSNDVDLGLLIEIHLVNPDNFRNAVYDWLLRRR